MRWASSKKTFRALSNSRRLVPQVWLVLRDLRVAKSGASLIMYCRFCRHFGSRVAEVVLAQVSQRRRDLGHPAPGTPQLK